MHKNTSYFDQVSHFQDNTMAYWICPSCKRACSEDTVYHISPNKHTGEEAEMSSYSRQISMKLTVRILGCCTIICWEFHSDQPNGFWDMARWIQKSGAHLSKQACFFGKIRTHSLIFFVGPTIYLMLSTVAKPATIHCQIAMVHRKLHSSSHIL